MQVHDIELMEDSPLKVDEMDDLAFYVYRNMKFIDCCDLDEPHTVMVPLRNAKAEEVVRIICQNGE